MFRHARPSLNLLLALNCWSAGVAVVKTVAGGGDVHIGEKSDCVDEKRTMDGVGSDARFNYPWGIAYDGITHSLYVADCVSSRRTKLQGNCKRAQLLCRIAYAGLSKHQTQQ